MIHYFIMLKIQHNQMTPMIIIIKINLNLHFHVFINTMQNVLQKSLDVLQNGEYKPVVQQHTTKEIMSQKRDKSRATEASSSVLSAAAASAVAAESATSHCSLDDIRNLASSLQEEREQEKHGNLHVLFVLVVFGRLNVTTCCYLTNK